MGDIFLTRAASNVFHQSSGRPQIVCKISIFDPQQFQQPLNTLVQDSRI